MQFNPYLYFNGDCEEAFKFYEQLLGGKIEAIFRNEGSPAAAHVPPEWANKILHARMTIGQTVLMASDAPPGRYHKPQGFSINIAINDPVEAERIFRTLEQGGTVSMPFEETFWAFRFGMVSDRFGVPWMINVEKAGQQAA